MSYDNQIVLFTPSFPKNEENTIAVPTIYLLAKQLLSQIPATTKLAVLALHFPFDAKQYKCFDIDVIAIGGQNNSYPNRFIIWWKAIRKIKQLHRQLPIKLIHCFWLSECTMLASKFTSSTIPKLVTLMGQDTEKQNKFLGLIDKSIPIVGINSTQKEKVNHLGFSNFKKLIPWGIDKKENKTSLKERQIDLLYVSTFIELKQPLAFLAICNELIKEMPNLKITMVGYGPLEAEIQKYITAENIAITIHPKLKREEIFELYATSKVLVHTSNFEAFGMVIPEALNHGCKVVSKKVGCAHDFKSANWSLANTPNEFVEAINVQLKTSFKKDLNFWDFEKIGTEYLKLYQNISAG